MNQKLRKIISIILMFAGGTSFASIPFMIHDYSNVMTLAITTTSIETSWVGNWGYIVVLTMALGFTLLLTGEIVYITSRKARR